MALVKRSTSVSKSLIIAIAVIVVLVGGYFVAQRIINPLPPDSGLNGTNNGQVITEFGESILNDPRFTELQPFGHSVTIGPDSAGNPNPFE